MSYTNVFGGNTIYPSDVSYLALSLTADNPLEWPLESSGTEDPAARIIDVTPTASGYSVIMPDATQTGAGQTILFNNLSGSYNFYVKDFAGNTLATVGFGEQWQLYLAVTTTAAGTWRVFRYGASTATVQPSALAGFGLTVTGSTLSQSLPVTTFSTTGLTLATSNRAGAFVWNGSGAGTLNLLTAASAGNNYFVLVRNEGGGDLTIDPSGTETINGMSTLALRPGDSCTVITDGVKWYTVGLGQEAVFAFDYTSISVTGGNYTLAGSELNRIAYKFVGTLTSDVYIIIPATVQQYWITNATTGSFNFYVKISGGTPTQIGSGAKGIYYCDGTNVILASDPTSLSVPVIISQGGTGATTASGARLNLGITTFADAIVTATTGASVRTTIGAAASGANTDITSLSGLTTPLSIAQGGTAATTAGAALTSLGAYPASNPAGYTTNVGTVTSVAMSVPSFLSISGSPITTSGTLAVTLSGTALPVANGGTGATSASAARTSLGATTVGGNIFTLTNPSAVTFLQMNADNTVSALDAASFRTAIGVGTGTGSVTSVAMTVPSFLSVSGSPITTSGTLAVTLSGTALPVANGGTGGTSQATAQSALGVPSTTGSGASGTWGISISGNAATATSATTASTATTATSATTATTATTANALNTGNSYQVGSLGVGVSASGTAGEIRATNNVTAYYSSDARLKEKVQPINDALGIVSAIGGKTFDWTDEYIASHGGEDGYFVRKADFGVIAQDVEAVFPMAVRTREDGTRAVDYSKLIAVAFQAIVELRAEVEALKNGA